jgi:class 3 adenylate cyclase
MAVERVQRRMAAILAADVAGYSRLMGRDEEATLATLKAYRELIDGLIAHHEGRVFGSAGDSVNRSREFIAFLKLLDAAYPAHTAIHLILDNHSAHLSKETQSWLSGQPAGRFKFTFTPKHGSSLNLVEGFFSKLARSVLRHIRVSSKQELKERLMAAVDFFNQDPVVHTWTYKLDRAA